MSEPLLRLQFQKAEGLVGKLIAAHDGGPFSHVELEFVPAGVAYSAHLADGGTRFVRVDFTDPKWVGVDVLLGPELSEVIRQWCELTRRKYSLRNIAHFTTPLIGPDSPAGAVICSEVCLMALQQVLHLTDLNPATVSPNALYKIVTSPQ